MAVAGEKKRRGSWIVIQKISDGHIKFGQVSDLTPSPFPKGKGNKGLI